MNATKYIGINVLNGIVIGAKDLGSTVEFRVLIDHHEETHTIAKEAS